MSLQRLQNAINFIMASSTPVWYYSGCEVDREHDRLRITCEKTCGVIGQILIPKSPRSKLASMPHCIRHVDFDHNFFENPWCFVSADSLPSCHYEVTEDIAVGLYNAIKPLLLKVAEKNLDDDPDIAI